MERNKKQKKEQPRTLSYILVLRIMSSSLSCFFFFFFFLCKTIGFTTQMLSFKQIHNLNCLDHRPLSKDLGTNLKLLINKTAWFHCTLLLGPLSEVALSFMVWFLFQFKLKKVLELEFKLQESKHEALRFNNAN
jgi:hypothetical protein